MKYIYITILTCLVFFSSCSSSKVTEDDVEGIWFLKELEGQETAYVFNGGLPTINFDWDRKEIFGTGGCNRYTAAFTLNGNSLKIEPIKATDMACEHMDMEMRFFELLQNVTQIKLEKESLILSDGKNETLRLLKLELSELSESK